MPRTKPGTRANRSCASWDQAGRGPFPFPVSPFPSSKASSRPVVTIPLTVSSGCESIVVPPIFTPRDATSWVSMGFVSSATTRPQVGQRNAAARVPSPGSWRSSNCICRSHSTHKNFIVRNAECGMRNCSPRAPELRDDVFPHVFARMEWYSRQHRDPELGGALVRGTPHERAADHVLDHAEQRSLSVVGGTKCAAHRVPGLRGRDGHGEHGRWCGHELGQLLEALDAGREIYEQLVEGAPGDVGQELAQRRGFQGLPPHVSFGFRSPERQRSAVLEEKCHGEAANAFCAHQRLYDVSVQRATGDGEVEQLGSGGPVEIRVEDAGGPPRPRECPRESRRHEALADAALAAQHRHDPPYHGQPVSNAASLGPDLVGEPRPVGFGQLVIGADVEGHWPKDASPDARTLRFTILLPRSVVASCNAIFSVPMIDELKQRLQAEVE